MFGLSFCFGQFRLNSFFILSGHKNRKTSGRWFHSGIGFVNPVHNHELRLTPTPCKVKNALCRSLCVVKTLSNRQGKREMHFASKEGGKAKMYTLSLQLHHCSQPIELHFAREAPYAWNYVLPPPCWRCKNLHCNASPIHAMHMMLCVVKMPSHVRVFSSFMY
jgi:hypothetical protein